MSGLNLLNSLIASGSVHGALKLAEKMKLVVTDEQLYKAVREAGKCDRTSDIGAGFAQGAVTAGIEAMRELATHNKWESIRIIASKHKSTEITMLLEELLVTLLDSNQLGNTVKCVLAGLGRTLTQAEVDRAGRAAITKREPPYGYRDVVSPSQEIIEACLQQWFVDWPVSRATFNGEPFDTIYCILVALHRPLTADEVVRILSTIRVRYPKHPLIYFINYHMVQSCIDTDGVDALVEEYFTQASGYEWAVLHGASWWMRERLYCRAIAERSDYHVQRLADSLGIEITDADVLTLLMHNIENNRSYMAAHTAAATGRPWAILLAACIVCKRFERSGIMLLLPHIELDFDMRSDLVSGAAQQAFENSSVDAVLELAAQFWRLGVSPGASDDFVAACTTLGFERLLTAPLALCA